MTDELWCWMFLNGTDMNDPAVIKWEEARMRARLPAVVAMAEAALAELEARRG